MDNPENLATLGTQDEENQNKQEKHFTEQVKDITKIYLMDEKYQKGLDLIMIAGGG